MTATNQYAVGTRVRITKKGECPLIGGELIGWVRSRLANTSVYFVDFFSRDHGVRCYTADEFEEA